MGWSASWIAVKGASKETVLSHLALVETGEAVSPGTRRTGLCCTELSGGWLVVFSEDFDWANNGRLIDVSRFGLALACRFEDKVEMTSELSAAEAGVERWRVFHNSVGSIYRLDVTGDPPAELASIRDRAFQVQAEEGGEDAGVDLVHDVPLDLGKAVCGYRSDEFGVAFAALHGDPAKGSVQPRKPGLIDRLFAPFRSRTSA